MGRGGDPGTIPHLDIEQNSPREFVGKSQDFGVSLEQLSEINEVLELGGSAQHPLLALDAAELACTPSRGKRPQPGLLKPPRRQRRCMHGLRPASRTLPHRCWHPHTHTQGQPSCAQGCTALPSATTNLPQPRRPAAALCRARTTPAGRSWAAWTAWRRRCTPRCTTAWQPARRGWRSGAPPLGGTNSRPSRPSERAGSSRCGGGLRACRCRRAALLVLLALPRSSGPCFPGPPRPPHFFSTSAHAWSARDRWPSRPCKPRRAAPPRAPLCRAFLKLWFQQLTDPTLIMLMVAALVRCGGIRCHTPALPHGRSSAASWTALAALRRRSRTGAVPAASRAAATPACPLGVSQGPAPALGEPARGLHPSGLKAKATSELRPANPLSPVCLSRSPRCRAWLCPLGHTIPPCSPSIHRHTQPTHPQP